MLVKALEKEGVKCRRSPLRLKLFRGVAKLVSMMKFRRLPFLGQGAPVFVHLNHPWRNAFYPYVLRHPLVTFSFDLWPETWDKWQKVFELNRPRIAFISARLPMSEMQKRVPGVDFRWLPEAVDPEGFDASMPLYQRPVDVYEIGRAHRLCHQNLKEGLAAAGVRHVYPQSSATGVIPYAEVVRGYAKSKIVICFPRSITHPEKAGRVETTTFRYFECMASKALMIGHCPSELKDIFGFNPVIEADLKNPAEQILNEILPRIGEYQTFVDRNHAALCSTWTVHHQARVVHSALKEIYNRTEPV